MTTPLAPALDRAIAELPALYPGPGGAVAVLKDGEAVVRHAWGFADLEGRKPYTPATLAPICSITKEFTCGVLLDQVPDPSALDAAIAVQLPRMEAGRPTALHLAHNQSGLRDYWALTVLCGSMPEGDFRPADAAALIGLTRSLHFAPGTRYSYSNGNFRMLATALQQRAGRAFGDLVVERVVRPAGMETAVFEVETAAIPGGAVGYEGAPASGWRPGVNRIHWEGDAGICASLDDMIAWERFVDRTREDASGLYRRLSKPVAFADGHEASYGFGLVRKTRFGRRVTGHGGAIRGWRSHRLNVRDERLSVVVFFNHESDSQGAALHVLAAALGEDTAVPPAAPDAAAPFLGTWLDTETNLLLGVARTPAGILEGDFAGPEPLRMLADGSAAGAEMMLARQGDDLLMTRPSDNIRSRAVRVAPGPAVPFEGVFRCAELAARMLVQSVGGSLFAGFGGVLGAGPMMPLTPVAPDRWRLECRRSLDAPAPGDWTVRVLREAGGAIAGVSLGCWLARDVLFTP